LKILQNNIAVLDYPDDLSEIIENIGSLESQDGPCRENIALIKQGDWVVDGGAALGDHTAAYIQRVGASGRVFAFEPHPDYFECLKYNCPQAVLFNCCLSNRTGTTKFLKNSGRNQGASMSFQTTGVDVCCMALDDLKLERLDLFKLDVEGSELHALLGATETICRCGPKIQIEYNPASVVASGSDPSVLLRWFQLCDYDTNFFMGCAKSGGEIIAYPKTKCSG
jgi:FkbM family methyltransferase